MGQKAGIFLTAQIQPMAKNFNAASGGSSIVEPACLSSSYINDVVKSRVIRLCKHLPRMESFILSKEERKEDLSAQRKRQRIDEHSNAVYEPQNLSATLWKHLRITTASLSKHVRPGTTPR